MCLSKINLCWILWKVEHGLAMVILNLVVLIWTDTDINYFKVHVLVHGHASLLLSFPLHLSEECFFFEGELLLDRLTYQTCFRTWQSFQRCATASRTSHNSHRRSSGSHRAELAFFNITYAHLLLRRAVSHTLLSPSSQAILELRYLIILASLFDTSHVSIVYEAECKHEDNYQEEVEGLVNIEHGSVHICIVAGVLPANLVPVLCATEEDILFDGLSLK